MAINIGRRAYDVRSDRIVPNVQQKIFLIDNDISQVGFLALSNRLRSRSTPQEKVTWDVDEFSPIIDTVDGAVASTTQKTVKVDNPTYFIPGELWENKRSGEIMAVESVVVSTQIITFTRAVSALNSSGGTAAANINDGDQLNRLGPFVSENSARQVTRTTTTSEVFNYCQIFRKDLSLSERQMKRQWQSGDSELSYQSMKQLKEMRMETDRTYLFGQRARYTDSSGDDVTLMGGLRANISTNAWAVNGTLFKNEFDEFCVDEAFRYGSRNKVGFCSTKAILAFTQLTDQNLSYTIDLSAKKNVTVGISVLRYVAPNGGELLLVEDKNISEQHSGEMYIVDMSQLERRVFTGNGFPGDFHVIMDTQDADDAGRVDTLMADQTLTYGSEKCMAKLTGINGGSWRSAIA